jgi:phosphomevalonate kinase
VIVRAPGKVVLSGAYAVLEGAPALVAAVDRYATADAAREASMTTREVQAAIDAGALSRAPWFDAAPLRADGPDGRSRKLGLGSSAAILVASLASARASDPETDPDLLALALRAHRAAQGGGSGIDVAASVRGGILACTLDPDGDLHSAAHALPRGAVVEIFSSALAADTPSLLDRVRAHAARAPAVHRSLMADIAEGARAAVAASDAPALVRAVSAQVDALARLGDAAGVPIVTPELRDLRPAAAREGASFGPSGAGGGDVAIFVGPAPSSAAFGELARARGLERLDASVGARGVHRVG